jgi:hypothetical protein
MRIVPQIIEPYGIGWAATVYEHLEEVVDIEAEEHHICNGDSPFLIETPVNHRDDANIKKVFPKQGEKDE